MEASTWVLFSVVVSIAIPLACYTYSHWGDER